MEYGNEKTATNFKRLNIDRKVIGILSVVAFLGVCFVIIIIVATSTLSGLRGFGSLQTHWTELRKEATFQLVNYVRTGHSDHLTQFNRAASKLDSARQIRARLLASDTDPASVTRLLEKFHIPKQDHYVMITTFERFHQFSDFKNAVRYWIRSDELMAQMKTIGASVNKAYDTDALLSRLEQNQLIADITKLDRQLTETQYQLAASLSSGTQFLNTVVLWISTSLGIILLLTGGTLLFRFLRSIKSWHKELAISQQKYRSLFEQNPNAVFSLDRENYFTDANEALQKVTGESAKELFGKKLDRLIDSKQFPKVKEYIDRVLDGNSQKFEIVSQNNNGELLHFEMTMLPIYVDNNITGAYGIAQDVTEQKKAERKLKEQLEEKIYLLAEVHDRVKNNLALILSLMYLQQDSVEHAENDPLENTITRIHSIAMVHEQLYQTETFSQIRMDKYIEELGQTLFDSSELDPDWYQLELNTESISMSIDNAIPLGLILNELLKNAFDYAFAGQTSGVVHVRLIENGGQVEMTVSDDGIGLSEKISLEQPKTLGFRLIKTLVQQLNGKYQIHDSQGTTISIQFSLQNGGFS